MTQHETTARERLADDAVDLAGRIAGWPLSRPHPTSSTR